MDDPRKPRTFTIWEATSNLVQMHGEEGLRLTDLATKICMFHIYDALSAQRGKEETSPELLRLAEEAIQLYAGNTFPEETIVQLETELDRIAAERAARTRTWSKSSAREGVGLS